jgi:hypothetical protein
VVGVSSPPATAPTEIGGEEEGVYILVHVSSALDAGLRSGIAIKTAQDELDLAFDLAELGVRLSGVSTSERLPGSEEGTTYLIFIYRCCENQAYGNVSLRSSSVVEEARVRTVEPRDEGVVDHSVEAPCQRLVSREQARRRLRMRRPWRRS